MTPIEAYLSRVEELKKQTPLFAKVEVEVNLGCNRRCAYCFLATKRREHIIRTKQRVIAPDVYNRLLTQLQDLEFTGELNFHFYSEPLLDPSLSDHIRVARHALPDSLLVLYSNGDRLDVRRYEALKAAGLDRFYLTFHDDVIPDRLKDIINLPDVVFDRRATILLNNRGGYLGKNRNPQVATLPCVYPALAIVVTIEGNVLPCSCDFDEQMSFGNINAVHLRDIWRSPKATQFRDDLLNGWRSRYKLCEHCDYFSGIVGVTSTAEASRDCGTTTARTRTPQFQVP
jgi:radical SAM protein with 4Fe4S-binding SPASM domain